VKSLAADDVRLDHEPKGARDLACRGVVSALILLATSCLAAAGGGSWEARADSLSAIIAASQTTPRPAIPAFDSWAATLLPGNVSAELHGLVRDAIIGRADAENDLGTLFALGTDVPRSFEQAAFWYRRAADQGVASAAYNLGVLLERGLGVPRDPAAALARFRQAADTGHAGALNALGVVYRDGLGVARDPAEALVWFRRASIGGNPRGTHNVGRLYESGDLGAPDLRTAAGWYQVAADAGDEQARSALARLQSVADGGGLAAFRTGFVVLAPGAGLLALEPAVPSPADPEPILDQLAARMAGSAPSGPVEAAAASAGPVIAPEPRPTTAQIREIQRLLATLNFDVGRIDGRIGRRTRSAVAAFQRSRDLPVTRRPSVALLRVLRAATTVASND
jgi:hypothetical protein